MAEYVVAQAAVLIVPTLDNFQKKLDAELKRIQTQTGPIKIDANLDSQKAVAQFEATKAWMEKQDITLVAKVDTRTLTEIRHKYEDLQREFKKALILDLKITGMNLLPQAASAMAALNASMVQLAQSATLLPGVFSGVLSSIGALATGLSGVKAAFKEYSDAQKNNIQTSAQARNNAINVQNAYRDLGRAFKDAQRNLEDLNAQLRDAPLDEADAIIRVQEAIAEANDKAGKSGLQQQKDALAVIKAENALVDVRTRNSRLVQDVAEANAKGVNGSDRVAEATDRLTKAQEVANAATQKLTDSLKQLSPNAQSFVTALTGMSSQWMAFKNATQDRLFAGLDQDIVKLAQTDLPMLQKGFGAIADSLNGNVKSAFKSLESETNIGFLDNILGNTAVAQGNLSQIFDPLTDSFLRLSSASSDLLPRLADGLTDLLTRFDNFVVQAEGDGSLDKWMNNGIEALKDLGNSIINVGSVLNSLQEAFTGSGGKGLLPTLEQGTQRLADFLKSAEGQEKLEGFFKSARDELAKWKPFLDTLPGLIQNVSAAGEAWANMLMPFLTTAGQLLSQHPGLVQAVFGAFMLWKNVAPVVKGVGDAVGAVNTAVQNLNAAYPTLNDKTQGAKKKFAELGAALVGPGSLVAMATIAATFLAGRLVAAHGEATAAADRQKQAADRLRDSLDQVTGAAGRASNAVIGKELRSGLNEATNQNFGDLTSYSRNPTAMIDAIKRGDKDAAMATIVGGAINAGDVLSADGGKFWQDHGQSLTDAGLTAEIVADALNGNKEAAAKYQAWQDEERRVFGLPAGVSKEILSVLPSKAMSERAPSLKDLQGVLPGTGAKRAALAGEINTGVSAVVQGGQDIRRNNQQDYGKVELKSGSPLAALGVVQPPQQTERGAGMIVSSMPPEGSPLAEEFRRNGVTFEPFDNGQFKVTFDQNGANTYLLKMATGGLISGPGSGTSDSILARLSHGEFVVNAAATQQHLPLLESINGGKLPGFAPGGVVIPQAPTPAPNPPSLLDKGSIGPSFNSSGAAMDAANRPGEFDRGEFQSYGQAQIARRGKSVADAARPPEPGKNFGTAIVNSVKAGLGLEAEGYNQVSTAKLTWNPDRTPVKKPDTGPKIVDPNAPKSIGDFYSQMLGVPMGNTPSRKPFPMSPSGGDPAAPKPPSGPGLVPGLIPSTSAPVSPSSLDMTNPALTPPITPTVTTSPNQPHLSTVPVPGAVGPSTGPLYVPQTSAAGASYIAPSGPIMQRINDFVAQADQLPYVWGGFGPNGMDCSGLVLAVANIAAGKDPFEGGRVASAIGEASFFTGNEGAELTARGFRPGPGGLGTLTVGWDEGHTGITLPDGRHIDAQNETNGIVLGEGSRGATGFPNVMHLPISDAALNALAPAGGVGSPSNIPASITPTGVALPQLSFAPNSSGDTGGGLGGGLGGIIGSLMDGTFKMPSPDEYGKSVVESWQKTFANAAQSGGQILASFLGGLTGLDLSGIGSIGNGILGDFGGSGKNKDGKGSGLPANAAVAEIIKSAQFKSLPPEYQQQFLAFMEKNPTADPVGVLAQAMQLAGVASPGPGNIAGMATGGAIKGAGSGTSDSILARVSNGEYIVKASAAQKNLGLLNAINSGLPGFADGMLWPVGAPAPVTPPPVTTPTPPPAPVPPDPAGPAADAQAGIPAAPTPVTDTQGSGDQASTTLSDLGSALGGIGGALQGADAPAGADPTGDPRSIMGAAPQNFDHNKPAISKGIESAAGAIAGAVSTAMSAASMGANAAAPGSGQGVSSAAGIVNGLISTAGSAVSGAVNILSSLGVGTLSKGSTSGAYGTPLTPEAGGQQPYAGPAVVNNWNGGVHTSNNEEFFKQQQRKELQNASPYLPQR